jgi:hypothetical protein
MSAYLKYRKAIDEDEKGGRHLSHAFFSYNSYYIQLLGRYWFWVDDESGREWEYAADSWDEMFDLKIDQIGMSLREAMEKTPPEILEIE